MPDIYQGNELWDFSLVDPDNRRAVDYARRRALLAQLQRHPGPPPLAELLAHLEDGRCKLLLTWKALQLRREQPQLFSHGDYRRLTRARRPRAACVRVRAALRAAIAHRDRAAPVPAAAR